MASAGSSRLEPVRRRAKLARAVLAGSGIAVFGAAALLARLHFPGHAKAPVTPLAAPDGFVQVVRDNQLEAGIIAPAEAPPGAASAPS